MSINWLLILLLQSKDGLVKGIKKSDIQTKKIAFITVTVLRKTGFLLVQSASM